VTTALDMAWRPPHAYIPGRTPRHPEDLFDACKLGLDDVPMDRLHETASWEIACAFFDERYFWEAHEVLEAIWMVCLPNSPEKVFVQAFIQHANAELKREMGMERATTRLRAEADRLTNEAFNRVDGKLLGFDLDGWRATMNSGSN